jgi:hypothetical protein
MAGTIDVLPCCVAKEAFKHLDLLDLARLSAASQGLCCLSAVRRGIHRGASRHRGAPQCGIDLS